MSRARFMPSCAKLRSLYNLSLTVSLSSSACVVATLSTVRSSALIRVSSRCLLMMRPRSLIFTFTGFPSSSLTITPSLVMLTLSVASSHVSGSLAGSSACSLALFSTVCWVVSFLGTAFFTGFASAVARNITATSNVKIIFFILSEFFNVLNADFMNVTSKLIVFMH